MSGTRQAGYYWVTFKGERIIADWDGQNWWYNDDRPYCESAFENIGPPVAGESSVALAIATLEEFCRLERESKIIPEAYGKLLSQSATAAIEGLRRVVN